MYLTTDRGSQFESELFECLAITIGFCRLRTTAYHPQSNGQIERFNRTLKEALNSAKSDWLIALPIVLFGIRIKPDENGISALSATTGLDVLIPNSIVNRQLEKLSFEYVRQLQSHLDYLVFTSDRKTKSSSKDNVFIPKEPSKCSHVWLRIDCVKQPLKAPYSGPHEVVSFNHDLNTAQIKVNGLIQTVSIQRLKPCKLPLAVKKSNEPKTSNEESQINNNVETKST